jgi:hypothetical protein
MKVIEEIRRTIKDLCSQINERNDKNKPIIEIPKGATGSAAGLPFENWFRKILSESIKYDVFERLEFMRYIAENYLEKKIITLKELHEYVWWGDLQQFTDGALKRVERGGIPKLQQALGDIIVKYGEDLNDVILINVKATEISDGGPVGRPPNIISALRLLNFLVKIFKRRKNLKDKINVWLVGFYYLPRENNKVQICRSYFKDLFKLDLEKAPPINFDAAIQIQWHLAEMVEDENQTLDGFAIKLGRKYLSEWESFKKQRDEEIRKLVNDLFKAIKKGGKQTILL